MNYLKRHTSSQYVLLILSRFPANENDYPREVWCQKSGLMWLVKNKYILSTITVGPRPYWAYDVNFNPLNLIQILF